MTERKMGGRLHHLICACLLLPAALCVEMHVNHNGRNQTLSIERRLGESWFDASLRVAALSDLVTGQDCVEDPFCVAANHVLPYVSRKVGCLLEGGSRATPTLSAESSSISCRAPLHPAIYLIHGGDPARRLVMEHQLSSTLGPFLAATVEWVTDEWARERHRRRPRLTTLKILNALQGRRVADDVVSGDVGAAWREWGAAGIELDNPTGPLVIVGDLRPHHTMATSSAGCGGGALEVGALRRDCFTMNGQDMGDGEVLASWKHFLALEDSVLRNASFGVFMEDVRPGSVLAGWLAG